MSSPLCELFALSKTSPTLPIFSTPSTSPQTLQTFLTLTHKILSTLPPTPRILLSNHLTIPGAATLLAGLISGAEVIVGAKDVGITNVMKKGGVKVCVVSRDNVLAALGGWEAAGDCEAVVVVVEPGDLLERCYDHRDHLLSWEEFVGDGDGGDLFEEMENGGEGSLVVVGEDGENERGFKVEEIVERTRELMRRLGVRKGDVCLSHIDFTKPEVVFLNAFAPLLVGTHTVFADRGKTLLTSIKGIQPDIFLGSPQFWRQLHARITKARENSSLFTRLIAAMESLFITFGAGNSGIFGNVKNVVGLQNGRCLGCLLDKKEEADGQLLEDLNSVGLSVVEIREGIM